MVFGRMPFLSVFLHIVLHVSILSTLLILVLFSIPGSGSPNSLLARCKIFVALDKGKTSMLNVAMHLRTNCEKVWPLRPNGNKGADARPHVS